MPDIFANPFSRALNIILMFSDNVCVLGILASPETVLSTFIGKIPPPPPPEPPKSSKK